MAASAKDITFNTPNRSLSARSRYFPSDLKLMRGTQGHG